MSNAKPLFYQNITALNCHKHQGLYLNDSPDFSFAGGTNSVPLNVAEFAVAASLYPIVFLIQNDEVVPIAVLGTGTQQNVWVDEQGQWLGEYIPAYIRRYPFISVKTTATDSTLCIDRHSPKLNEQGEGHSLFEGDDSSPFLQQMLEFCQAYELELARNQHFSALLQEFALLEPSQLNQRTDPDQPVLSGFMVVSKERLAALAADELAKLHKSGALELIYQHLFSLQRFQALALKSMAADDVMTEATA